MNMLNRQTHHLCRHQSGAALLAFALILIVGSTYALMTKLNSATLRAESNIKTINALNTAKSALLGWAISHPVYPGALPMPDRNGDSNYDGDSDCYNGTISNSLLLGKIPWRDFPSPTCKDSGSLDGLRISVTDSAGQQLWYAVSKNLVYESPDYPDISLSLLDKTTDWITVRDQNGNVISDQVAFVVIAPGFALTGQDRSGTAPAASNYLDSVTVGGTCSGGTVTGGTTYNHSDTTNLDFIIYPNSDLTDDDCDSFNDQLVFMTIDELMEGVKKRVLSEVSNVLTAYHNDHGALPWLVPYFDPKADSRILYGTHTGSDNATSLTDDTTDFKKWGVKKGDIVRNVTDGSLSIVTVDNNSTTLTVTGIHLGTDNDFDTGDEYYVVARDLGKKLDEKANASSSGSTLVDDNQEFVKLDVVPGDIIDNYTDGSSGIVETVTADTITVRDLTSGSFDDTDEYLVRSYAGEGKSIIPVSDSLILKDDHKDFIVMGVSPGDVIINLRDGSIGRVASVTQTSITAASMNFGLDNDFDDGDEYILPRFNGVEGTHKGLISFHREGEFFPTEFDIDWNIPEFISATVNATVSLNTPGTHTDYITNLKQFVQTSSGTSGTITVDIDEGTCVWTLPEIVECKGSHTKYDPVQGQVTSGSNTAIVTDNTKDFVTLGINPGDIVQNYDDESFVTSGTATAGSNGTTLVDSGASFLTYDPTGLYNYLVRNTSLGGKAQGILAEIDSDTTLSANDYSGWNVDPVTFSSGENYSIYTPAKTVISAVATTTLMTNRLSATAPDFDTQEFYRVKSASGKLASSATAGSSGTTLEDTSQASFTAAGIQSGDVVRNVTDNSWGEISTVGTTTLSATLYDSSGNTTTFDNGDSYEIYYAYMNSRRYEFRVRFNGTTVTSTVNGSRKRGVCLGYTDCTGSASNVSLPFYNLGSSGTATAGSSGLLLEDDPGSPNFDQLRIYPGHVVVNTTDGSNGIITTRDSNKKVSVDELNDGAENDFDSGESYYITAPVVTIKDYDASENELGSAAVVIPSGGAQGSIRVSNIDYYLRETTNELPDWFIQNKWYQYVYIAYSAGEAPGAGAVCTAGTDCLELNIGANTKNDIRAIVMLTGEELSGQTWTGGIITNYFEVIENTDNDDIFHKKSSHTVKGSATSGSSGLQLEDTDMDFTDLGISAGYIVNNTTDGSSGVVSSVDSSTTLTMSSLNGGTENDFDNGESYEIVNNDMIRIAVSCPSDSTKLCWSN